jgi:hypothetical protein
MTMVIRAGAIPPAIDSPGPAEGSVGRVISEAVESESTGEG